MDTHLRDIAGMLKILGEEIDQEYISHWANRLKLKEIWEAILKRIK